MDTETFLEKYKPILITYSVPIVIGIVGLICLGYGMISFSQTNSQEQQHLPSEAAHTQSTDEKSDQVSPTGKTITVDVEGAVMKPGVYQLEVGSRIQDALIAAGGMSDSADRSIVAKSLNLASSINDGGKIYIPLTGEQVIVNGSQEVAGSETKIININQASVDELDTLPGIGQTTAQKIIANRPYQNIQEIVQKKSIGAKEFEKIKASITVN